MNAYSRALILLGVGLLSLRAMGADVLDTHIAVKNVTPEEAAVWKVIDDYWGRSGCCGHQSLLTDSKYLDYVSDDALIWDFGGAGVQTKAAVKMWTEANEYPGPNRESFEGTRVNYQLYPQGLVIHGNVALAHYRFHVVSVSKDNPNKASVVQGRYSDILVRDHPGAPWKFLSWIGGVSN